MALDREVDRLRNELENAFSELWHTPRLARRRRGWAPAVDVIRTESPASVTVLADLAGVDPGDVRLSFAEGVLSISGIRRPVVGEGSGHRYEQMEIDYGPFERRVPIGDGVDVDAVQATYRAGMLSIVLPVAARPVETFRVVIAIRGRE
ncbi:MAG: Hsp20/alpha crystallin family protein [Thermoleophilia bacterium]